MKQKLLFLSLIAALSFSVVSAQCDPWITQAYKELYNRQPSAQDCNIRNYNNGSWNNYTELVGYIKNYNNNKAAAAPASNCDIWIIQAYKELYNRTPTAAECNIRNYNNGSWGSYGELVGYIRSYNYKSTSNTTTDNVNTNTNTNTGTNTNTSTNTAPIGKSEIKGDPWIFKAYRELYRRNPNAGELTKELYNKGSWRSYEELRKYISQFNMNLNKNNIKIKVKDLGTGYLLVGFVKGNAISAMNLISADGGRVVAAGGMNLLSANIPGVVAAGGMNLRDIVANFIKENGGFVVAAGGLNLININSVGLSQAQLMSSLQNMAGASIGGLYGLKSVGETMIPASGEGALIFK